MTPHIAGETLAPLALRISRAVQDGDKVVTLELHPADLGRVEVRLSFHADGVGVQMTVDRAETFDSFSRNRTGMEQQLAQAGIDLGSGGLDLRLGQQSGGQPDPGRQSTSFRVPAAAIATMPIGVPPPLLWAGNGLLNIVA